MRTYQIKFENKTLFDTKLTSIKDECDRMSYSHLLFHLSWAEQYSDKVAAVAESIETFFPEALYYGNEAFGSILEGNLSYGITVDCVIFEDENTHVNMLWIEEGTRYSSLNDLWDFCRHENNLRAVELISSSNYVDTMKIDKCCVDINEDIRVFGGASINYRMENTDAPIICKGHLTASIGLIAVLYYGAELHISCTYILGWKGLGRHMKVTKSSGKIISEIDGMPAFSIYEKYLDLQDDDNDNLVFPLIVEENGIEYIRTPRMFLPDKKMLMIVDVAEGSQVRISYGDKNTILNSLHEKSFEIAAFQPQALKAYSCGARKVFWGDGDIYRETLPLQEIAPIYGFYTGGEILRFGSQLSVLNSTLVIVSFREGESDPAKAGNTLRFDKTDKSLLARITHFVGIMAEEQEEQKVKLQEALLMAQSADRAKTIFLNNMSHDIRTPMNAVIGFTGLAQRHIGEWDRVQDYLGKIEKSSNHLLSLINDVLDMSRIESGRITLEEKGEDLREIIHTIYDIVSADIQAKNLEFIQSEIDVHNTGIVCDKLRLNQVLLNILSNAIKYTPEGGKIIVNVKEMPSAQQGYSSYVLTIRDTGMGMEKEFLATMFEPFTRVKSTTVSGIQGTGLGMAIAKNIVDLMKGNITVESEPNKGTCVTLYFDFKLQSEESEITAADEQTSECIEAAAEVNTCQFQKYNFAGRRVLLVEDNELNREIATQLLEEYCLVVDTAEDGDIAVQKIKTSGAGEYDLILMDIQMPRMDGYEATRILRESGMQIPILAMTANAFEEDRQLALSAGMNDHITKPINIQALTETLGKYL